MAACLEGHYQVVKILVLHKVDINETDDDGFNAL